MLDKNIGSPERRRNPFGPGARSRGINTMEDWIGSIQSTIDKKKEWGAQREQWDRPPGGFYNVGGVMRHGRMGSMLSGRALPKAKGRGRRRRG
jgi:hypothetical protein